MVNERQRRIAPQASGSGQVAQANALRVARRQTARGMQGSWETRAARTALRTLLLNRGWDPSWQPRQVLPRTSSCPSAYSRLPKWSSGSLEDRH